jgi:hypothetical protein
MKRKNTIAPVLAALAIIVIVGLAGWREVSVWQECRAANSWLYCWGITR